MRLEGGADLVGNNTGGRLNAMYTAAQQQHLSRQIRSAPICFRQSAQPGCRYAWPQCSSIFIEKNIFICADLS